MCVYVSMNVISIKSRFNAQRGECIEPPAKVTAMLLWWTLYIYILFIKYMFVCLCDSKLCDDDDYDGDDNTR